MPRSYDCGVNYIISRNLRFQCINTLLVSLLICLYRHFAMSDVVGGNKLSWGNYLETLVIISFLSFAIGLYWRFKFRSRYLSAELEETKLLNEQLKKFHAPQPPEGGVTAHSKVPRLGGWGTLTLTGTTNEHVTLDITDLLYIEAVGNYVKVVNKKDGEIHTHMLRATMKQMEDSLQAYPMIVRCHRAFMVNLGQVEQISSNSRAMQLVIPIRTSHANCGGYRRNTGARTVQAECRKLAKRIGETYYVRMDRGDEIISNILEICRKESIPSAIFSGIGGCSNAELQVFIPETGSFETEQLEGMLELQIM